MKYLFMILIFSSFVYASCSSSQVDINSAGVDELDEIVWIGEATATRIIDERPFGSLEELDNIYGIGEKKLQDIIDEGIACVENDDVKEKQNVEKEKVKNEIIEPQEIVSKEIEPILLNDEENLEVVVYESKDSIILDYLPHAFCVFLILIIAVLVLQRF